jgi:hypothetical protein
MIIKVSWESMINYLFQNNDKMINQIFISKRVSFDLYLKVIKGASHDTRIFIAKGLFHFLIHLLNWAD